MNSAIFISVTCFALIGCALAWPDLYDNTFKRWSLSRRSFDECKSNGGKCYSTSDCCQNYVCAALDDLGLSPTMPGRCVHEKELESCLSNYECSDSKRCVLLGEHSYCIPLPSSYLMGGEDQAIEVGAYAKSKGKKGANCESSSDCEIYDLDGVSKLCCQKIRRGRQGTAQKCDIVKPISTCLN